MGQLQVQQAGDVEHILGDSFITELVVVEPHKRQVTEAVEVVSEKGNNENSNTSCLQCGDDRFWGNACTVYLLWDVIYTVPVQEKLYEAAWNTSGHLLQRVMSQVKLHKAPQVLEGVLPQVAVTQLTDKTSRVCSTNDLVRLCTYCI